MIDRPDWGSGGENRNAVVPAETPKSPDALVREIATQDGPGGEVVTVTNAPTPLARNAQGQFVRKDWNYDRQGKAISNGVYHADGQKIVMAKDPETGLPISLVREMANTADGIEGNVGLLKEAATNVLDEAVSSFGITSGGGHRGVRWTQSRPAPKISHDALAQSASRRVGSARQGREAIDSGRAGGSRAVHTRVTAMRRGDVGEAVQVNVRFWG